MSKWKFASLGEICEITGGNSAPQGTEPYDGGIVPFVRMRDLGRYHFTSNLNQTDNKLTEDAIQKYRMKVFEPGCILFPRSGSVFLNHRAILGVRASIVSHIGVMQNFSESINNRFLYYFLQTYDMTSLSKKTTGVDSIAFSDVARIKIPLPTLPEQERIVRLLDEADALRKLRAQADMRTEEFVPALFYEMFGDVKNTKRWQKNKLGDLCEVRGGGTPSTKKDEYWKGDIPWVSPKDMIDLFIADSQDHISISAIKESATNLIPINSVLVVTRSGILKHTLPVGITTREVTINQDIKAFIPNKDIDPTFLLAQFQIKSPEILSLVRIGATVQNIQTESLKKIMFICPPLDLQHEFAERVKEARQVQTTQAQSAERVEALYQSMLSRAFQGEL